MIQNLNKFEQHRCPVGAKKRSSGITHQPLLAFECCHGSKNAIFRNTSAFNKESITEVEKVGPIVIIQTMLQFLSRWVINRIIWETSLISNQTSI